MPLAISSYLGASPPADSRDVLHLGWTCDEREFLDIDLPGLVIEELAAEIQAGLQYVHRYPVTDPYADQELASAVASYFSLATIPSVTCGAGVGSLLHGLSGLATGKRVGVLATVYPDFPFWVSKVAHQCAAWMPGQSGDYPEILFMERPALLGDQATLDDLRHLCAAAASHGTLVLVDESNANYYPPSFSAITIVAEAPNLAVARGFSKAYGLGGLRLSYCVTSSAATTGLARSCIPPLLASSLSLRIGKQVLLAGDITEGLRVRISLARGRALAVLEAAGLPGAHVAGEHLPYLLLDVAGDPAAAGTRQRLEAAGIFGKGHICWDPSAASGSRTLYRLSVPLASARMDALARKLTAR
jgi:histidinol-phosphate aminotransferase